MRLALSVKRMDVIHYAVKVFVFVTLPIIALYPS